MKRLLKKEIRTVIPVNNEEDIIIKNSNKNVEKYIKEHLLKKVNGEKVNDNDVIDFLIKELTNIELNYSIDELLKKDISIECQIMLYHISLIYQEISQEFMMNMKLVLEMEKTKNLELEVINKIKNK